MVYERVYAEEGKRKKERKVRRLTDLSTLKIANLSLSLSLSDEIEKKRGKGKKLLLHPSSSSSSFFPLEIFLLTKKSFRE